MTLPLQASYLFISDINFEIDIILILRKNLRWS